MPGTGVYLCSAISYLCSMEERGRGAVGGVNLLWLGGIVNNDFGRDVVPYFDCGDLAG